jgi:hypothetical protein
MELSGITQQVPSFDIYLPCLLLIFRKKLTGTSFALCACEASFVRLAV